MLKYDRENLSEALAWLFLLAVVLTMASFAGPKPKTICTWKICVRAADGTPDETKCHDHGKGNEAALAAVIEATDFTKELPDYQCGSEKKK